jgi:hypothetical protein
VVTYLTPIFRGTHFALPISLHGGSSVRSEQQTESNCVRLTWTGDRARGDALRGVVASITEHE